MTRNRRFRATAAIVAGAVTIAFTPAPVNAYDRARVKQQIRRAWRGNDAKAIRVADCESSLNPKARSPSGTYLGLWQFDRPTWRAYGPGNDPRDYRAYIQTKAAWRLFKDRGWQPWPTCRYA